MFRDDVEFAPYTIKNELEAFGDLNDYLTKNPRRTHIDVLSGSCLPRKLPKLELETPVCRTPCVRLFGAGNLRSHR